jgi:hypothetical protein
VVLGGVGDLVSVRRAYNALVENGLRSIPLGSFNRADGILQKQVIHRIH